MLKHVAVPVLQEAEEGLSNTCHHEAQGCDGAGKFFLLAKEQASGNQNSKSSPSAFSGSPRGVRALCLEDETKQKTKKSTKAEAGQAFAKEGKG